MPDLGAPVIASTESSLDYQALLAAAKRCFDAWTLLHRIVLLWEAPGIDANGHPFGQACDVAWVTEDDTWLSPRKSAIPDAFKVAAWDFQESFGRAHADFCDPRRRGAPSSWRIGRDLSVWMFDNDDFRSDPMEYVAIEGAAEAAAEIHPVFPDPPSGHDLVEAVGRLRREISMVYRAIFEDGTSEPD